MGANEEGSGTTDETSKSPLFADGKDRLFPPNVAAWHSSVPGVKFGSEHELVKAVATPAKCTVSESPFKSVPAGCSRALLAVSKSTKNPHDSPGLKSVKFSVIVFAPSMTLDE